MTRHYTFDKNYYERFYGYPRIRAGDRKEIAALGDFVCSYLRYLGQPMRRVLDIGCGLGLWQGVIAEHFPKASYTGVETSEFLCEQEGWIRGSVVDFKARGAFGPSTNSFQWHVVTADSTSSSRVQASA